MCIERFNKFNCYRYIFVTDKITKCTLLYELSQQQAHSASQLQIERIILNYH